MDFAVVMKSVREGVGVDFKSFESFFMGLASFSGVGSISGEGLTSDGVLLGAVKDFVDFFGDLLLFWLKK